MLLIENGYLVDPRSGIEGNFDILTEGKKIKRIGKNLKATLSGVELNCCRIMDAQGKMVAPGLVDVHVHFRDPGFTHKEDIFTGAKAAAKGGFTSVILMANTKPTVDTVGTLSEILAKGEQTGIHVHTCANVTVGMQGKEMVDMDALKAAGAVGFTDDGIPIMDEKLVKASMEKVAALNVPISFHEEDPSLITNNGVNRGVASEHFGIGGSPREAEYTMVERDLKIALETGADIDIQHISTKEAVEMVRQARKQSSHIHAEATPHHFTLTEEAVIEYGTLAKMNPPLRTEEDRKAIIKGLQDGTIDLIATDHAPHTMEEKGKELTQAPSGIIGLETALPLAITKLVKEGHLTMKDVLTKMSYNPAQLYHLDAGYIAEGGPADLILVDVDQEATIREFASKSPNSPFVGWKLSGVVETTICDGKVVYNREWNQR